MAREEIIRLAFFLGTLAVVAIWEIIAPRRSLTDSKLRRWFTNLSLVVIDTTMIRLILPTLPFGMAVMAQEHGWGILNTMIMPLWLKLFLAVVLLDFVIYLQHALFHFIPTSQFNHGNIRIPVAFDRWLRFFVVTPDMHRVHHSIIPRKTNSNFGFNLPCWDRLCGTYRSQPEQGHTAMTIGLKAFRDPARLTLPHLLVQPFIRKPW